MSWLSQKHNPMTQDIMAKWNTHWSNLHKYPTITPQMMQPILFYYYPDLKKDIRFREFLGLFHLPNEIQTISIDRLDQPHYDVESECILLNLPMGSGKTAQTARYLNRANKGFMWLVHRTSLNANTIPRLKEAGIEVVDYSKGITQNKPTIYEKATNLSICINSLFHIPDGKKFHTIVIDEIESVLHVCAGDFLDREGNKALILQKLINLLISAKKIILIDAFITTATIDFIRTIRPDISATIYSTPVKSTRTLNFFNTVKDCADPDASNDSQFDADVKFAAISKIVAQISQGQRVVCFYPGKLDMENFVQTITIGVNKASGRTIQTIHYNADVDDKVKKTLSNVQLHWKDKDLVVFNNCITCGVNYDLEGFDSCWCFMAHYNIPRDIVQATARVRKLASNTINVVYMGVLINKKAYLDDTRRINIPAYTKLYNNFLIEVMAPKRRSFEAFCAKAGYIMKKSKVAINAEICKEMEQIFNETDCKVSYTDIPIIDNYAEEIQNLIYAQTATMMDKLSMQKFFWRLKYRTHDEEVLANIWDAGLTTFNETYYNKSKPDSIFTAIQTLNKWATIIPPDNFKNVALDKPIIDQIFKEFRFQTLTPVSNKNLILKTILNTVFNFNIISVDAKNSKWGLNSDFMDLQHDLDVAQQHFIPNDPMSRYTIEVA